MAYLIIPIICFVLLAGLAWVCLAPFSDEKVWKGKIDDLDVVLSVLMTAEGDEPYLVLKVPGRLTSMKLTFPGSAVRLEVPLVTQRQRDRKDSDLALLGDLGLETRVSRQDGDKKSLECEVEGLPSEVATLVKGAFLGVFDVDPDRTLEFRAFAHLVDQNVIEKGLDARHAGDEGELPTAATRERQLESSEETRTGCLKLLAGFLLLPVPFVIAYLLYGYLAASALLAAYLVLREIYQRWKGSKHGFHLADVLKITILLPAGATLYFTDPFYLQLVPTIFLSVVAVAELLAVSLNLPRLSAYNAQDPDHSRTGRWLFAFAVIATCAGGTAMNEYLRGTLTLDAWVWFFAFFRIELVFGFLVASIPLICHMARHLRRSDGDTESP